MIRAREALKRDKELVLQPRFGFGSRLCKGEVLASLTSMVLHGNHLDYFTYTGIYLFVVLFSKRMCVKERFFLFYYCARLGLWPLCLRITHRVMRNHSSVVRRRKYLCVGWFYVWGKSFRCEALRRKNEFYGLMLILPWIRVYEIKFLLLDCTKV